MNTTIITDPLAAYPEAPIPTTVPEALRLLGETRRLMDEHGVPRRSVSVPTTMRDALDQLAVDREALAEALRDFSATFEAAAPWLAQYCHQYALGTEQVWATPCARDICLAVGVDTPSSRRGAFDGLIAAGARDDQRDGVT